MRKISTLATLGWLAALAWTTPAAAQTTGAAPGCCGLAPVHDSPQKSMLGTAVNATASAVYFTGYEGNVSEVYYPTVDTLATSNMEFLVGDTAKTFVDEEKLATWKVTQPDTRSMRWQAVTGSAAHNWQITKTIFADPLQNTLIQQTTFAALNGKTVGNFNLYLLLKPYLNNVAANNSAATVSSGGRSYLVANSNANAGSDSGTVWSALGSSLAWTVQNGTTMVSNAYYGVNDGWQDLLGGSADKTMNWAYGSASGGNVAQMGWLATAGNGATSVTFTVVLGYGASQAAAVAAASGTLGETVATQQTAYDNAWHGYTGALSTQGGSADNAYYLSAMTLKTMQDKSNGAMIAGIGTPWGAAEGDGDAGGYHLIWPRDMFKFANALITAGDTASATKAVNWLFNVDQETANCGSGPYNASGCPGNLYTQAGRFPQNAWANGTEYWQGTQMDEQAMPIVLAYRLGPTVYNPLWTKIKATASYLYATGPWTYQERWEENAGYSPSTIAAEIAGLVDAAQIALANGDTADAANWLNAADDWQQNVQAWTYTTQGCPNMASYCGSTSLYERINTSGPAGGALPGGWNPAAYPNTSTTINIASGGGTHRAIDIVDGGFLELVRFGVKRPADPSITASLATYDAIIKQTVNGNPGWFRYNFDAYGETNSGGAFDASSGRGRLWPIFTAERGNYQIAASGSGSAGTPYLQSLKAFATPSGFFSEQVWNTSTTLPGDADNGAGWTVTTPAGATPGTLTGSMAPLNWATGEYINLLASIAAGKVVDIPPEVCARYSNCTVAAGAGQSHVSVNVTASTVPGQYLYVTGNTAALGNWNTNLGLPVDPTSYPVWKNGLNLATGTAYQYKYYRKNADGSVTWECYPGNGNCASNRALTTPASGPATLNDTVTWN